MPFIKLQSIQCWSVIVLVHSIINTLHAVYSIDDIYYIKHVRHEFVIGLVMDIVYKYGNNMELALVCTKGKVIDDAHIHKQQTAF